jgi:hypothetical protein
MQTLWPQVNISTEYTNRETTNAKLSVVDHLAISRLARYPGRHSAKAGRAYRRGYTTKLGSERRGMASLSMLSGQLCSDLVVELENDL